MLRPVPLPYAQLRLALLIFFYPCLALTPTTSTTRRTEDHRETTKNEETPRDQETTHHPDTTTTKNMRRLHTLAGFRSTAKMLPRSTGAIQTFGGQNEANVQEFTFLLSEGSGRQESCVNDRV